jgi:hypothetical protein
LAARSDCLAAYPLRTQSELDSLVKLSPSRTFQYDAGRDAAKLYHEPKAAGTTESIPGNQQLRFPLHLSSGSVVLTWDFWWGPEFISNIGSLDVFKSFRMYSGDAPNDTKIFWSFNDNFVQAPAPGDISVHQEDLGDGLMLAAGVESEKPYNPTGAGAAPTRTFLTKVGRWTRYWVELRFNVPGEQFTEWRDTYLGGRDLPGNWIMASLWIADEDRAPARVVYRAPVAMVGSMLTDFRFLFNTSSNAPALAGPVVGYGRNVVILRNTFLNEGDTTMFSRPSP